MLYVFPNGRPLAGPEKELMMMVRVSMVHRKLVTANPTTVNRGYLGLHTGFSSLHTLAIATLLNFEVLKSVLWKSRKEH